MRTHERSFSVLDAGGKEDATHTSRLPSVWSEIDSGVADHLTSSDEVKRVSFKNLGSVLIKIAEPKL